MKIEVLYVPGCPNHGPAVQQLKQALAVEGFVVLVLTPFRQAIAGFLAKLGIPIKIWILFRPIFKLLDEGRALRVAVRVKQVQFVGQSFLRRPLDDAVHRGNPDAARQKHRRFGRVFV